MMKTDPVEVEMSFNEPFDSNFNKGDLIYGLSNRRYLLVRKFKITKENIKFIDNYSLISGDKRHNSKFIYDQDFIDSLKKNEKYEVIVGNKTGDEGRGPAYNLKQSAINKRKCKGGLEWVLREKRAGKIHFLLNGIDMGKVATKEYDGPGTKDDPPNKAPADIGWQDKQRSITGSELRWIYRNRADPAVQKGVQFWLAEEKLSLDEPLPEPTTPPWTGTHPQKWREAFASYQPTKEFKPPAG